MVSGWGFSRQKGNGRACSLRYFFASGSFGNGFCFIRMIATLCFFGHYTLRFSNGTPLKKTSFNKLEKYKGLRERF